MSRSSIKRRATVICAAHRGRHNCIAQGDLARRPQRPQQSQWEKTGHLLAHGTGKSEGCLARGVTDPGPLASLSASPQVGALRGGGLQGDRYPSGFPARNKKRFFFPARPAQVPGRSSLARAGSRAHAGANCRAPTLVPKAWLLEQQHGNPWGLLGSGASGPCLSYRVRVCTRAFSAA